jgi:hypothetical protein
MALDLESRELLSDIYQIKPNKKVFITKRLHANGFLGMLDDLEKKGIIESLYASENEFGSDLLETTDKGTLYNIRFGVKDWHKLDEFGIKEFNNLITEPYGKDKQLQIVKAAIIKKSSQLENTKFRLGKSDVTGNDKDHIVIFEALKDLEKEKFLKLTGGTNFDIKTGDWACDIELLKDLNKLKGQPVKGRKSGPASSPKFHFNQGVLFRDFCDEVLIVRSEKSKEHTLLIVAMFQPVMTRIDAETDDVEMDWRRLYDAARRLNDKIKNVFDIENFFQLDFENKKLWRAVE